MKHGWGSLVWVITCTALGQPIEKTPPDASFRISTRLVQVSAVAQDKDGKPIRDLQRDEFHLYDNGSPQPIRLFLAEGEKSNPLPAPATRTPNTFSNQISSDGSAQAGYSVILIDNLFTIVGDPDKEPGGRALARLQALRALRSSPPDEKIAIYAVGRKLAVICEFTSDRDLLERQLTAWMPSVEAPPRGDEVPEFPSEGMEKRNSEVLRYDAVRVDALRRAPSNEAEMELMADHLAGIPGRKNLIWLSTRFVIGPKALGKLSEANVAIYPVDLDGVCDPISSAGPGIPCPPRPIELISSIAAQTGGVAFYGRNDLDMAMREAMVDGRASYTLGFYESGDESKPNVHQLGIRVDRPGVNLRYRATYQTEAHASQPGGNPTADLRSAMDRPVDSSVVPISASAKRTQDLLDVVLSLDVASLGLELSSGTWRGSVELAARFVMADGVQAGDVLSERVNFRLQPATYTSLVQSGVRSRKQMKIPEKATAIKVLVGNPAARRIGTLTIPLSEIESVPPGNAK